MRRLIILFLLGGVFCGEKAQAQGFSMQNRVVSTAGFYKLPANDARQVFSFNNGWYFFKGDKANAQNPTFNDKSWQQVQLPHGIDLLPAEASGGVNYQGVVWYRKHFLVPTAIANKKLSLCFEAIMGKCNIYLNGKLIADHKGGYLPIIVNLDAPLLKLHQENIIAIMADNRDDSSYPPGKPEYDLDFCYFGGIYRDAWLVGTKDVYITNPNQVNKTAGGGVLVHYENVSKNEATVVVSTDIANVSSSNKNLVLETYLQDIKGNIVAKTDQPFTINAKKDQTISQTLALKDPLLWHPDHPYLYQLYSIIKDSKDNIIDGFYQRIGVRSIAFKGDDGFYLNGEPFAGKLIGANRHQDFAYIGNAMPNDLHYRDAKKLRDAGIRVIRASHYPEDPAFMDACDELGIFVIVATPGWQFWNKAPEFAEHMRDDIRQMIRRDRNHPSVLAWECVPNETGYPASFAKQAYDITHREYPFADCVAACNYTGALANIYDLIYGHSREIDFKQIKQSVFTREWGDNVDNWDAQNSQNRAARNWGEIPQLVQATHFANPDYSGKPDIYDSNWESIYETPAKVVGGCLWHAFDTQRGYHPDPFYGGLMDAFRQPKYSYYLFKSQQDPNSPYLQQSNERYTLFIANELTPFSPADITVYTNCDSVKLIHGKDIVTQKPDPKFSMPHAPIIFKNAFNFRDTQEDVDYTKTPYLIAEGFANGKIVIRVAKSPSQKVSRIKLTVDMEGQQPIADGSSIIPVIASVTDDYGNVKRLNDSRIRFRIEGEGTLVGNASVLVNPEKTEWGTAPALIRTTLHPGKIRLIAEPVFKGISTIKADTIEFNTVAPGIPGIYNKTDVSLIKAPGINNKTFVSNAQKISEEKKRNSLKEVENDQKKFSEHSNKP